MSTPFTAAFDAIQTALGNDAAGTLVRGNDTLAVLMGSGVQGMRQQDETGRIITKMVTARYKATEEPDKPIAEGDLVALIYKSKTTDMRVEGRMDIAGLVRLTLIAEFQ